MTDDDPWVWEAKRQAERANRAEAAISSVRALVAQFQAERPIKVANLHFVASAILAALGSSGTAEDAPTGYRAADMPKPVPGWRQAANADGLVMQHTCGAVRAFDRPPPAGRCGHCPEDGTWTQLFRRDEPAAEKVCGWCANGDCANCDWDEHEPPERCTHSCLSVLLKRPPVSGLPVDGETT